MLVVQLFIRNIKLNKNTMRKATSVVHLWIAASWGIVHPVTINTEHSAIIPKTNIDQTNTFHPDPDFVSTYPKNAAKKQRNVPNVMSDATCLPFRTMW
mmetsp:Transcript_37365/g.72019  ORF Transcript_37365/g.72019 Transcript_37365/m.72019 type:complete len:98 (+) Transcript_37365:88-381(+)